MVEPHVVLPESEIKRLEEVEKKYNSLKNESANNEEKLKTHQCDHSECEKKIAELKDKYEELQKVGSDKNTNEEKATEATEEISQPTFSHSTSEYDPENIHYQKPSSNKTDAEVSTSKKPWYYIGSLDDV